MLVKEQEIVSIIRVRGKNGNLYAVESTSHYVPGKGSRPVKKYLGRINPDTGEIIPSTGKRGRPRKEQVMQQTQIETNNNEEAYEDVKLKLERSEEEVLKLTRELDETRARQKELAAMEKKRRRILISIRKLLDELENDS